MENIAFLCDQILSISTYRAQLYDYLKSRMAAIAPNLTCMLGELVGAKLIAHAGSLLNLAKAPASTVQILGAEKALFRALKTKHDTPKYGLIYHASLVGQGTSHPSLTRTLAAPKLKGKIARTLATKTALSVRVDALGENVDGSIGLALRAKVEARLMQLEGRTGVAANAASVAAKPQMKKVEAAAAKVKVFNEATDLVLDAVPAVAAVDAVAAGVKRKSADEPVEADDADAAEKARKAAKKAKKAAKKAKADRKQKAVAEE